MKKEITKSFHRFFALLIAFMVLTTVCITPVSAETLSTGAGVMNVTTDGTNLYVTYSGPWEGYVSHRISLSAEGTTLSAPNNEILITGNNNGDSVALSVSNAYSSPYAAANATATNSDPAQYYGYNTMSYTATVPLNDIGADITTLNISFNGASTSLVVHASTDAPTTPVDPASPSEDDKSSATDTDTTDKDVTDSDVTESTDDTDSKDTDASDDKTSDNTDSASSDDQSKDNTDDKTTTDSSTEDTTEDPAEDEVILSNDLNVDGFYAEWSEYPSTIITYLSNNTYQEHYGQLMVKDGRLYAHFKMNELYDTQMRFQRWDLTINKTTYPITIIPVDGAGNMDWSQDMYNLPEGTTTNYGVYVNYYDSLDGKVAFTVHDGAHTSTGEGDEIEFSISLSELAKFTNMKEDEMSTFTLRNPNIGNEGVTIAGTPTGAYGGILSAAIIAMGCAYVYTKSQKKSVFLQDELATTN